MFLWTCYKKNDKTTLPSWYSGFNSLKKTSPRLAHDLWRTLLHSPVGLRYLLGGHGGPPMPSSR